MPDPDRNPRATPAEPPSDELVLAAIERAERHRARDTPAVPVWAILDHLAVPRRSAGRAPRSLAAGRPARGRLARALAPSRGGDVGADRAPGRRRLQRARRAAQRPAAARVSAAPRVARRAHGRRAGDRALPRAACASAWARPRCCWTRTEPPHSDAWFELGEELQRACRRVGSASHCLHEWVEPHDAPRGHRRAPRPRRRGTRPGRARASARAARGDGATSGCGATTASRRRATLC